MFYVENFRSFLAAARRKDYRLIQNSKLVQIFREYETFTNQKLTINIRLYKGNYTFLFTLALLKTG